MPAKAAPRKPGRPAATMGRPRSSTLKMVSFKLQPELIDVLDHFAEIKHNGNRTAALVACVNACADPTSQPTPG